MLIVSLLNNLRGLSVWSMQLAYVGMLILREKQIRDVA
jgi:hypothetical protein